MKVTIIHNIWKVTTIFELLSLYEFCQTHRVKDTW